MALLQTNARADGGHDIVNMFQSGGGVTTASRWYTFDDFNRPIAPSAIYRSRGPGELVGGTGRRVYFGSDIVRFCVKYEDAAIT